jgi:phosphoglycolate phosphatase-like HAD superfamily hydrolase
MPDFPPDFPTVLALDFDGVLCDGLKEYFQTSWRAYTQLWLVENSTPPAGLAESFYRLRPVILTGWEMPVLLHAIVTGISETEIERHWATIAPQLLQQTHLQPSQLAAEVDGIRDRWIAEDLGGWLAEHRFYPGVIDRLQGLVGSPTTALIISTKEKRFIQQLLQQQGVDCTRLKIFGKETQRPKSAILQELLATDPQSTFWFVEDRLDTLTELRQIPALNPVRLFLADWGYNTQSERESIDPSSAITLISLEQFSQNFSGWLPPTQN